MTPFSGLYVMTYLRSNAIRKKRSDANMANPKSLGAFLIASGSCEVMSEMPSVSNDEAMAAMMIRTVYLYKVIELLL